MKSIVIAVVTFALGTAWAETVQSLPAPAKKTPTNLPPRDISTTNPAPKLVFATNVLDFGKLAIGRVIRCEFSFSNAGPAQLELTRIEPTCDCISIPRWTHTVAPGGTGSVSVEIREQTTPGDVLPKHVLVHSNDPRQPVSTLTVVGTLWKPIEIKPPAVPMEFAVGETNVSRSVRLTTTFANRLYPLRAEADHSAFQAEIRTNTPGRDYEVIVRVVGPLPAGTVRSAVTVKSESSDLPEIEIPVAAVVKGAVLADPPEIILSENIQSEQVLRLYVRNRLPKAIAVKSVKATRPDIGVSMEEIQPGQIFYVTMRVPAEFRLTVNDQPEVVIATTSEEFPELRVPIRQHNAVVTRRLVSSTADEPRATGRGGTE